MNTRINDSRLCEVVRWSKAHRPLESDRLVFKVGLLLPGCVPSTGYLTWLKLISLIYKERVFMMELLEGSLTVEILT